MKILDHLSSNVHWLIRAALSGVFMYHGILKFADLQGSAAAMPISYFEVVLVALAETGGGLLLLAGGLGTTRIFDLATRVGALLNIPTMLGAIVMVHWGQWNFVPSETHPIGGMEFMVTLILLMIYVAVKGNHGLQCDTSFRAPTPIAV